MVGGGEGAFIGAVHRLAARIDGRYELVAGALSSTPDKARASAAALGLDPDRAYGGFEEMAAAEAGREDGIEAAAVVTPNHVHRAAAEAFLARGIHVICDKPLTSSLSDAEALAQSVAVAAEAGTVFVLTHNYSGYPLVRQAREMVARGDLGAIRVVQVEYPQDWLAEDLESTGQKQAGWRTDPAKSGAGGATGDIGTHAFHLAGFVTGLKATRLAADLTAFVPGRRVDDNGHVLLRYDGGARGMLWCSQVAPGHENALRLRVFGEAGGLDWAQENPNIMRFTPLGEPTRTLTRNGASATEGNRATSRIPAGHPEGYLEGFANVYGDAAEMILAARDGGSAATLAPTAEDGLRGVRFIDACVRSSAADAAWVEL
jgi:predicted dehydrogenase